MPDRPQSIRLHAAPARVKISARSVDELSRSYIDDRCAAARREGFEAGQRQAIEQVTSLFDEAAERLDGARREAVAHVAPFAVDLAVEIARSIVKKRIEDDEYDIERIVRDTLAASSVGRAACTVHLSPRDFARLEGVPFRAGTELEADPSLEPGNLQITTPQGLLVHGIEAVLDSVREGLYGELE